MKMLEAERVAERKAGVQGHEVGVEMTRVIGKSKGWNDE